MKRISLSLIALAPFLMAAEQYVSPHDGEVQTVITNQAVVNEVLSTPTTVEAAENVKIANTGSVGAQVVFSNKINIVNIPLAYSITDSIAVDVAVPFVQNSVNEKSGIGDVSVALSYNFSNVIDTIGLNTTSLRYKSTSGGDALDGLGSGASAFTLSHAIVKSMGSILLHGSLLYTLNSENDIQARYGDAYNVMIGESHSCLLTDYLTTTTKLTYFHNDESTFGGNGRNDELTTADFYLEFSSAKILSSIPLAIGVKIPVIYEAGTATTNGFSPDAGNSVMAYFSASKAF
ncbi:hypothetical protein GJV85_04445 [Sulfurimonas aquatica]|uniref:Transporter n=1 Tax=Sulfurimonas aquatica TaxID=2672570 RepID=A0A975AZK9_9BACT|nr:hypothetical protein [Sulfurimonas aquatica]QSZ41385.1 hypothetical protein GJV85_04445 [Sulfurimonas aquatica]